MPSRSGELRFADERVGVDALGCDVFKGLQRGDGIDVPAAPVRGRPAQVRAEGGLAARGGQGLWRRPPTAAHDQTQRVAGLEHVPIPARPGPRTGSPSTTTR
ncbi:hypothetical protein ACIOJE_40200 [Kitasatospora sp. NPDC087861]|uniref:hypothetical protein n=1 Tax=Kitasatospora sp. NPDC087861 TaxID=3364070 RepID=UPI00380C0BCB